jgi:hypothetical protein
VNSALPFVSLVRLTPSRHDCIVKVGLLPVAGRRMVSALLGPPSVYWRVWLAGCHGGFA